MKAPVFEGCGRFGYWISQLEYDPDFYREEHPELDEDEGYDLFLRDADDWYA